ncbi:hypothetical protein SAMN05421579_10534 [Xenorhabdus japonica]|uniref:Uncharacterized protein n=1 Tax=Xenorhabdus japonica TaxID=53341 RepID=A0A1I4ZB83_9GAMM|nr:hypothetical protein SAMN05421579_10534 [Xenorhabdus japonica]
MQAAIGLTAVNPVSGRRLNRHYGGGHALDITVDRPIKVGIKIVIP